jgi:hypothetical protein
MYPQENNRQRVKNETPKGETNSLVAKFVGIMLPIKGGSILIENTYGDTVWVSKFDIFGNIVNKNVQINQSRILPVVERADKTLGENDNQIYIDHRENQSPNSILLKESPRAKKLTMKRYIK